MHKGVQIGLLTVCILMYVLLLAVLLFVQPLVMVTVLMVTLLLLACIWRFRPEKLSFVKVFMPKEVEMPEMDEHREVFLSDLVLCSQDAQREHSIALNRKQVSIGMAEGCDIVLPRTAGVSRLHARIYFDDEDHQFYVVDQGSSNGTYLNNVRLRKGEPKILCKGDRLRFATAAYLVKSAYYR